ncbi:cupin domain-containing protein [Leucothrix arctica]|uniref:Cupin n=1 Tax=Leucothrix arctica TaxID=1481894 RepID=A0A317CRB8_9GAMM|nr:cupin domain-containing protein [Leucothrix arctica]PWQ98970.1 cupin [Leucothrix arctica]
MSKGVFGSVSIESFLQEHWQQKPLCIRGAFDTPELGFDAGELAGIALDTEAPARLLIEHGEKPWQLKQGPFKESDFTSLPKTNWTLLVNDIETYLPELQEYLQAFRFIPDWRIDDLMISFASDKGSVGAHVDDYDVFLIQLEGKRHWSIDDSPYFDETALEGPELKILKNFKPTQDWTLEPGDMLYLPPNLPHHGVADGECMTLSIGFRAPASGELVQAWLDDIGETPAFKKRFSDARRKPQKSPGEIKQGDLAALRKILLDGIENSTGDLDTWLGKYLTEGKRPDPKLVESMEDQLVEELLAEHDYQRFPGMRLAYTLTDDSLQLFVGGTEYSLDSNKLEAIQYLCNELEYKADALASVCRDSDIRELINTLIKNNNIVLMEPSPCTPYQEQLS